MDFVEKIFVAKFMLSFAVPSVNEQSLLTLHEQNLFPDHTVHSVRVDTMSSQYKFHFILPSFAPFPTV